MSGADQLYALTLWRPWPWVILHGAKRIENRAWPCPRGIVGRHIAIHAGKYWDADGERYVSAIHPEMPRMAAHPLGFVGVARVVQVVTTSDDPWFCGPYGWVLDNVVAIDPVPYRGAQGLWRVPLDALATVRERWRAARTERAQ